MNRIITVVALICTVLAPFSLHARIPQSGDPFDAAIKQIDTQSKELNQQVIARQEDGLASQKILRLELELTGLKTEHTQEIAALKKQHEQEIDVLKKSAVQTQQAHAQCTATTKKLEKELADSRAQHTAHQATITQLKHEIEQLQQEIALLIPPEHPAKQEAATTEPEIPTLEEIS